MRRSFLPVLLAILLAAGACRTPDTTSPVVPAVTSSEQAGDQAAAVQPWALNFSTMPDGPITDDIGILQANDPPNNEVQRYTQDERNARIEDGKLVFEARREPDNSITSAHLLMPDKAIRYGTIIWKDVRFSKGTGTWPALWLWVPEGSARYTSRDMTPAGGNDDLKNGEIDVMEWVGADPAQVNASAHSYLHYGGHGVRSGQMVIADPYGAHDYSLEWTPGRLAFAVDGRVYYTLLKAPGDGPADWSYDQKFMPVMNLAMGGDWGGYKKTEGKFLPDGIDTRFTRWTMTIGGIYYYPYSGS